MSQAVAIMQQTVKRKLIFIDFQRKNKKKWITAISRDVGSHFKVIVKYISDNLFYFILLHVE